MPVTSRYVIRSTICLLTVGLLALLGIVGMTIWLGERSQIYFNEVIEARDTRAAAVELRTTLQTAESSQRGFLATGNEIYLAPYDNAKTQALRQLNILHRALEPYPDTQALLQRLRVVVQEKIREMDETVQLKAALRTDDALAMLRSNRGKALMDEANVFLAGIIRRTDDRLTAGVEEQRKNALWLRWVSIIGGLIIILVVGGVIALVARYAWESIQARNEVRALNAGLEERVRQRTAEVARARDRAEVLLAEVNHRVANSLAIVASLVSLQTKAVADQSAKDALAETEARIYAISAVHKRLYSSGDVRFVSLDEYLNSILDHLANTARNESGGALLARELEPVKLKTDASINLGVIVTELVTNAFKYAYPDKRGEVRVRLKSVADGRVELVVEDDGVGRASETKGTGLGTRIVRAMAESMGAEFEYVPRNPGTTARLIFTLPVESATI